VARIHKRDETLDAKSLRVLAEVCRKLFSCSPNSADPERLFSELGRIVSPDRTQQCDELIEMKHVIAADVRASKTISRIRLGKTKGYVRSRKRFSEALAATLMLKAMERSTEGASGALSMVAQAQTLSVRDIVPMEAEVVHVGVSSIASETLHAGCLAANASSPGTSNSSSTNVASNIGINEDNYDTETETDDLSGFGNGIEYHSELKATDADIEHYSTLISHLEEGCQDFSNESCSSDFGSDEADELRAQALAKKSLEMYAHGMLPTEDDPALPKDPIVGFRGETFSLKLVFGRAVGPGVEVSQTVLLPSLTSICHIVPETAEKNSKYENDTPVRLRCI
jgi:hypothetical protein